MLQKEGLIRIHPDRIEYVPEDQRKRPVPATKREAGEQFNRQHRKRAERQHERSKERHRRRQMQR